MAWQAPESLPFSPMPDTQATLTAESSKVWSFRPDIEGLRAIAVIAVLLFHAGLPFARGGYVGVDVFFVISGFLITGILVREAEEQGSINLGRFYARRARRLLPASAAALVGSAIITYVFLPINRWSEIGGDIVTSALYVVNWRLAGRAVDYLASENAASPVQHFWSLSVEEQYYFLWPVLMVFGTTLALRRGLPTRRTVMTVVGGLAVASLIWSMLYTVSTPGRAYFVTTTRVWELALGAIVAIGAPWLPSLSKRSATWLAGGGIALILGAVWQFSAETSFPGWAAALPTVGTAFVIVAGSAHRGHGFSRYLGHPAALWIGARSYSLYLWHWPFVIAAQTLVDDFTPMLGVAAVALSFLPAALSHTFLENPIRHAKSLEVPRRALVFGIALTITGTVAGLALIGATRSAALPTSSGVQGVERPITSDDVPAEVPLDLDPSLALVSEDRPVTYDLGCHVTHKISEAVSCEFGDLTGPVVVLVGDSHAGQWLPAMVEIADSEGWHLYSMTKSACPYIDATFYNGIAKAEYTECAEWTRNVTDRLLNDIHPDLVVPTASVTNRPLEDNDRAEGDRAAELYEAGLVSRLEDLSAKGLSVVVLRDTPLPTQNMPDCLARLDSISECTSPMPTTSIYGIQERAVDQVPGTSFVDLTEYLCLPTECPPVVFNYLVWRDASHLSTSYAKALAPPLRESLRLLVDR